jgi:hypothetical protein
LDLLAHSCPSKSVLAQGGQTSYRARALCLAEDQPQAVDSAQVDVALATSDSIIVEIVEMRPAFVESFGRGSLSTYRLVPSQFYPGTSTSELRRYQRRVLVSSEQRLTFD